MGRRNMDHRKEAVRGLETSPASISAAENTARAQVHALIYLGDQLAQLVHDLQVNNNLREQQ